MGRIRILSDAVASKIAAGEVVERPASVVKELLENSLDAGASRLKIETEGGGRRLIRVSDDGCGMLRDDALLAFERHATSKLSDVKDLFAIATLGFRGEALPSIASVSRLVLETRSAEEPTGAVIEFAGGKLVRCDEAALGPGTTVTVRDLFYNVPVRRKFLRTEQTELAHVASLATHYSLAHPGKTFELYHGGGELLNVTPVASLRERVYQVFGARTLEEIIDLEERRREIPLGDGGALELSLSGYISRPQAHKSNRNSIYLFVNRRLIRDRLLLHALSSAYHNLMPASCYPFALLFLECTPEEVDVNVHPSKTEVRFRHGPAVHDFVRDAVRRRLIETRPASAFPAPAVTPGQAAARLPYSEFSQKIEEQPVREAFMAPETAEDPGLPAFTLKAEPAPQRLDFGAPAPPPPPEAAPGPVKLAVPESHQAVPQGASVDAPASLTTLADLRPLGQIHDSFIVAAGPDGLWLIDQHVAHERILFEQILVQLAEGRLERQPLLIPLLIELTPAQQVECSRIAGELGAMGFEIEPFGPRTIAVKATPAGVGAAGVERLIAEILEIAESHLRSVSLEELRRALAASVACHAAIKINTPLDHNRMLWLIERLASTDCPMSCPHGRPIALRYGTREILKGFHRV